MSSVAIRHGSQRGEEMVHQVLLPACALCLPHCVVRGAGHVLRAGMGCLAPGRWSTPRAPLLFQKPVTWPIVASV